MLQQIQAGIESLSDSDYNRLTQWLKDHDFLRWDKQITEDLDSGRLDSLLKEVQEEYRNGETTPLA